MQIIDFRLQSWGILCLPGLGHVLHNKDFNASSFSLFKVGFRSVEPAIRHRFEAGFVTVLIIEAQILFRYPIDMRQICRIISKLFAVLAKDHELAIVPHCGKFRCCMLVDCGHEFRHFSAVVDASVWGDLFPILKAVNDIQVKPVESAADNFVDVVEDNFLPRGLPVFYLKVVGPFRIGRRQKGRRRTVPRGLPVVAIFLCFADAQIADNQLVIATTHHRKLGRCVGDGGVTRRIGIVDDNQTRIGCRDLCGLCRVNIAQMVKPRFYG